MAHLKLVLDTNIIVDFVHKRDPFFEDARKLLICGRMGEFDLWLTSSQITDLVYILSDEGKKESLPQALKSLQGLRTFISILPIGSTEIDHMLASSWDDPEDCLLYQAALQAKADALITRNQADFQASIIPVLDCRELFDWTREKLGIDYEEVGLS